MRKRSPSWLTCTSVSGALHVSPRLQPLYTRAVEILGADDHACAACLFDAIMMAEGSDRAMFTRKRVPVDYPRPQSEAAPMVDEPDEPDNLVLRYLRAIDAKVDGLRADVGRIAARLDRIEKRLQLVEQIPNAVNFTGSVDK
jgi:hypothetical protein